MQHRRSSVHCGSLAKLALLLTVSSCLASAQAAQIDVQFAGYVEAASTFTRDVAGTRYDQWFLGLSGLPPGNTFQVAQGDTISATVTLNAAVTIPVGYDLSLFQVYLKSANPAFPFPSGDTRMSGDFTLSLGTDPAATLSGYSTTAGQLAAGRAWALYEYGAITFDSVVMLLTVNQLSAPATIDQAQLAYSLLTFPAAPVAEPGEWALLTAGLGLLAGIRRRQHLGSAARVASSR